MQSRKTATKEYQSYSVPGIERIQGEATGFFRVEERDGKWWMIDPKGDGFFMLGTDHVSYHVHQCQVLGYSPHHRYCEETFGGEEEWAKTAGDYLHRWHFNTLPVRHSEYLRYTRFAHIESLSIGTRFTREIDSITPSINWTGFPNVFSPEWPEWCDTTAREMCAPNAEDPWLIGYFLDNELQWNGLRLDRRNSNGLAKVAWMNPAGHSAKRAWIETARRHTPDIAAFNAAWNSTFSSFEELEESTDPYPPVTETARETCRAFVRLIAEKYFGESADAIRRHDPNHLVLGARFAGWAPDVWDIAGKYCDVVSFNHYPRIDVERGIPEEVVNWYREIFAQTKKPLMMTEWCFLGVDTGLPGSRGGGMKVRNQADRARCFRAYQSTLCSLPFFIGSNYFMYADEPILGIREYFSEDGNYGLVSYKEEPYEEFVGTVAEVQARAVDLHEKGEIEYVYQPDSGRSRSLPPIAENADDLKSVISTEPMIVRSGLLELNNATVHGCGWDVRLYTRLDSAKDPEGFAQNHSMYPHMIGRFDPAVLHGKGDIERSYAKYTRVSRIYGDGEFTVVDLGFFRTADPGAADPPGCYAYELGWRFWFPVGRSDLDTDMLDAAEIDTGWFLSRPLSLRNTGKIPIPIHGLCHDILPMFDTVPGRQNSLRLPVANYHMQVNAWELPLHQLGLGTVALDEGMQVDFFRRRDTCRSDCWTPLDLVVKPGETVEEDRLRSGVSRAAIFAYRIENDDTWLDTAEAVRRTVRGSME